MVRWTVTDRWSEEWGSECLTLVTRHEAVKSPETWLLGSSNLGHAGKMHQNLGRDSDLRRKLHGSCLSQLPVQAGVMSQLLLLDQLEGPELIGAQGALGRGLGCIGLKGPHEE